ncbi:MAG TPA: hypothetical protein PKG95_02735 [Anaerolineaceae bacterium]|jgi:hypothetical protein|nr:hypothetical protein [Anaerolineaceae bacterium]
MEDWLLSVMYALIYALIYTLIYTLIVLFFVDFDPAKIHLIFKPGQGCLRVQWGQLQGVFWMSQNKAVDQHKRENHARK